MLCAFGLAALLLGTLQPALAASGDGIFESSACRIITAGIGGTFGGMLTAIAGGLAILASVVGAFKAAWALLFVSVGCFIFHDLVTIFFPLECANN